MTSCSSSTDMLIILPPRVEIDEHAPKWVGVTCTVILAGGLILVGVLALLGY